MHIPLRTRQIEISVAKVSYLGLLIDSAFTVLAQRAEELELCSSNWILHQMLLFTVEVSDAMESGSI